MVHTVLAIVMPEGVGASNVVDFALDCSSSKCCRRTVDTEVGFDDALYRYMVIAGLEVSREHGAAEAREDLQRRRDELVELIIRHYGDGEGAGSVYVYDCVVSLCDGVNDGRTRLDKALLKRTTPDGARRALGNRCNACGASERQGLGQERRVYLHPGASSSAIRYSRGDDNLSGGREVVGRVAGGIQLFYHGCDAAFQGGILFRREGMLVLFNG